MAEDDDKQGFSWDEEDRAAKPAATGGFTWDQEKTAPAAKPAPQIVDLPGATPRLLSMVQSGKATADYAKPLSDESAHRIDPFNRQANEFLLGTASGVSGLPETTHPIKSAVTGEGAAPPPTTLKEIGMRGLKEALGPGEPVAEDLYHIGKEILSPQQPGESEEDAMARRSHGMGSATGQILGLEIGGEAPERFSSARSYAAEKMVAPLARKPPVATMKDLKYGQNAGRAIANEGLVAGSREGLVKEIRGRMGELSDVLDNTLQSAPGRANVIDAEPVIDKAIDSAVKEARKQGSPAMETRLETLRTALKTEYGPVKGTPFEMNRLKQRIGDVASDIGAFKATDPNEAHAAAAMQDVYHDLKDAINKEVPEGKPVNERLADLFAAQTGVNRNIALHINKSPFSVLGPSHAGAKALEATVGSTPVRTGAARVLNLGKTLDVPKLSAIPASTGIAPPPVPQQQLQRIGGPQMTLGLPPQNAPLFNIPVPGGANSPPPSPPPTIAPIHGTQMPLNLPPEEAPLFNLRSPSGLNSPRSNPAKLEAISPEPTGGQQAIRGRALESLRGSLEAIEPPKGGAPQKVKEGIRGTGFEFVGHKADAEFPGLGMTELRGPGNISVTILDREMENLTAQQIRERIKSKLKEFGR